MNQEGRPESEGCILSGRALVTRPATQLFPCRVVAGRDRRRARAARRRHLEGLAHQRGHNVDHRVVGRLPRVRVALGRVANDAERGLAARREWGVSDWVGSRGKHTRICCELIMNFDVDLG